MKENKAYLRAFDKVGRQAWHRSLVIPLRDGPESGLSRNRTIRSWYWSLGPSRRGRHKFRSHGSQRRNSNGDNRPVQVRSGDETKELDRRLDQGDSPSVADWLKGLNLNGRASAKHSPIF